LLVQVLSGPYLAASFPVRTAPGRSAGVKIRTGERGAWGDYMMLLPDFSEWQSTGEPDWIPTPDFAGVKRRNGGAAIIRVGLGQRRPDLCFTRNRRAAQRHKYAFLGLYHYTQPGDMAAQARAFCRWVGKLAPNEIPVVDIENVAGDQNGRAKTWFDIVDRKLGLSALPIKKRSWLYSGEDLLIHQLARVCGSGRNIWVAAYRSEEPTLDHILWQSTDGRENPGKNIKWPGAKTKWPGTGKCDTNVYHGTLKQLVSAISRDDLPYPRKKILQIVQQGVAAELDTELDGTGITAAQGAKAAVGAQQAVADLAQQVADLTAYVKQHLPDPPGMEHASTR
jgi:hypothetical protein